MSLLIPEWFDPTQTRDGDGCCLDDLRPSEVVRQTIPDPAEQAPLVARLVTPPSPSGRGGTTLLRQRAPRSCTVFVMTPPNEHTSEGGRDDRGVPYHAESALPRAQVLKALDGLRNHARAGRTGCAQVPRRLDFAPPLRGRLRGQLARRQAQPSPSAPYRRGPRKNPAPTTRVST